MYIVYSDNESEKKFLEEEFLFQSNYFAVPFNNVKYLQDLIGKTCFEFYQHNQSLFIEKFKALISGLIDFSFSFPLLRQLLSISKKKDLVADFYRNHFIAMNRFFVDGEDPQKLFQNPDFDEENQIAIEQAQKTQISHKTLETFEMDSDPMISLESFGLSSQLMVPKTLYNDRDERNSVFQSDRTNDQTFEEFCMTKNNSKKSVNQILDRNILSFATPTKLGKCLENNILAMIEKNKKFSQENVDESISEYLDSFKKQKASAVAAMIINQQSLGKIARKQKREHIERKKLEQELYEKTKSQKSNDYNRNIKTILLNKKLRQKKKQKSISQDKKSRQLTNVMSAQDLRKLPNVVPQQQGPLCPEEGEFSFAIPKINLPKISSNV